MKRVALSGIVAGVMALVLTGCPVSPPGYLAPRIDSVQITPEPVQPGGTVTFVVDARDDSGIASAVTQLLYTPNGTRLNAIGECTIDSAPQGSFTHVLLTVACPVPEVALNGTWHLQLRINDGGAMENLPGLTTKIPFQVAGGSDDFSPPQLVSYQISPAVVDQTTSFTLTARVRDDSAIFAGLAGQNGDFAFVKPFAQNSSFYCQDPVHTPVSATEVDVVVQCHPGNYNTAGRSEVGLHRTYMPVRDVHNNEGLLEMVVNALPAP